MKDRFGEDFANVITNLVPTNKDIIPVSNELLNARGVYYNPKAKPGFRYAAAFATVCDQNCTWVETFGIENNGTKMTVRGRWGSKCMGKITSHDEVKSKAREMLETNLRSM